MTLMYAAMPQKIMTICRADFMQTDGGCMQLTDVTVEFMNRLVNFIS